MNATLPSASLAILNYNGQRHLETLLPTARAAVRAAGTPCPIVVLDNRSPDGDADWLRRQHPDVEVVEAAQNDFLFSYHALLAARREEIVVLLNNDLRLAPGFLTPLLRHFAAPDVFAVGATSRDWDDTEFTCGPNRLRHHHGIYYWDWERDRQQTAHTLFTSGGFMAVHRRRFLELGGFNRLFAPAYGEDLDLCFRAWRRGWRCVFEPTSMVYHREGGTFSHRAHRLMLRSQLLFQWSSLPPAASALEHAAAQLLQALRRSARGEFWWPAQWWRTRREWQTVKANQAALRVSSTELAVIEARIATPVPQAGGASPDSA